MGPSRWGHLPLYPDPCSVGWGQSCEVWGSSLVTTAPKQYTLWGRELVAVQQGGRGLGALLPGTDMRVWRPGRSELWEG